MILLQVNNLTKSFGADVVLSNIKLEVQNRDRIALVGQNGAGKSTLLKIIARELSYDSGDIIIPKDVSMGYLAQNTGFDSTKTIWDEMVSVFSSLQEKEKTIRHLEQQLSKEHILTDTALFEKTLAEYDRLSHEFQIEGGYQYEADTKAILTGLGFPAPYFQTSISSLSGGQKTRLALGKMLLTKPDLLILDEPTNHLDIDTLTWLEQYLQNYEGGILIVSHDRYFLDKVVNTVYEISHHICRKFVGNYSTFLEQKASLYESEMKQYEKQQDEIARLQDFVQRNIARATTTKRAQSRRKQLDRMELLTKPQGTEKDASFSFEIEKQSGNDVLKVSHLMVGYKETTIATNLSFHLNRGDSVALVGPNGIGKSTLLKTLVHQLEVLQGDIHYGTNVTIGYYDQEQKGLTPNKRVLNELWDEYPLLPEKEIRTILGNFLFSGDDVLKLVHSLSGGEKARLTLAKLMLQKCNLLVLDEPTNHLDLTSKEILENALIDYPGTILFVSHDRYFINRIATKVIELTPTGAINYLGDYDYYIEKKNENLERERLAAEKEEPQQKEKNTKKRSYEEEKEAKRKERQRQRRIDELELLIAELEEKVDALEHDLCDPTIFQDYERVQAITEEKTTFQQQLENYFEEWESLQE